MFNKTKNTEEGIRKTVVGMKEDAREIANEAGHKVREIYDSTTHQVRDASATVEKQIRKNPVTAAAAALGVGVLFGMLFRRR